MDISYLKKRKEGDEKAAMCGWIPFLPATEGDFWIEVPAETMILDLMKEYRVEKWVNVSQAAGEETKPKLRGKRQQRAMAQDNYQKDPEMDLEGFSIECADRYISGWRDFFIKVPVTKEEWKQIPEEERWPQKSSHKHTKFFKRVQEPFSKDMAIELVRNHWIIGFAGIMIDQSQLLSILIDEEFGEEVKNS